MSLLPSAPVLTVVWSSKIAVVSTQSQKHVTVITCLWGWPWRLILYYLPLLVAPLGGWQCGNPVTHLGPFRILSGRRIGIRQDDGVRLGFGVVGGACEGHDRRFLGVLWADFIA